ncbi:hypothetical protein HYU23_00785 [Candidatus Woesearchaeota archaeon]|nr:hypothetical protein [Candidatus Woesearchaeota archaeon]
MTLIITTITKDTIIGSTDSALTYSDNPSERLAEEANKILEIPYINGLILWYGSAEVGGSTENWLIEIINKMQYKVNDVKDFSSKFGKELTKLPKQERSGFHISGFCDIDNDGKLEHFFEHWSNESNYNQYLAGESYNILSESMTEFKRKFNPDYIYLFFNGEHEIFYKIFNNYHGSLKQVQSILASNNICYDEEKVRNLMESLISLISRTCELFGQQHIGGTIKSKIIKLDSFNIKNVQNQTQPIEPHKSEDQNTQQNYSNIGSFSPKGYF